MVDIYDVTKNIKKKTKKTYDEYNIFRLLQKKFKSDKSVVTCVDCGDMNFTEGKEYKIYLSQDLPRIYDDVRKQHFHNSPDIKEILDSEDDDWDDPELPTFKVYHGVIDRINNNIDDETLLNHNNVTNDKENNMKRLISRLNGITLSQENLVELRQDVSERATIQIDLVTLLQSSEQIKKLRLGEDSILNSIEFKNDQMFMNLSVGRVNKEDTGAIIKALQDLVINRK